MGFFWWFAQADLFVVPVPAVYRQTGNSRGDTDETHGISTEATVNPFPQSLLSHPTDFCLLSEVELGTRDLEWGVGFQKP